MGGGPAWARQRDLAAGRNKDRGLRNVVPSNQGSSRAAAPVTAALAEREGWDPRDRLLNTPEKKKPGNRGVGDITFPGDLNKPP